MASNPRGRQLACVQKKRCSAAALARTAVLIFGALPPAPAAPSTTAQTLLLPWEGLLTNSARPRSPSAAEFTLGDLLGRLSAAVDAQQAEEKPQNFLRVTTRDGLDATYPELQLPGFRNVSQLITWLMEPGNPRSLTLYLEKLERFDLFGHVLSAELRDIYAREA